MATRTRAALNPARKEALPARDKAREAPERKHASPRLSVAGGADVIRRRCACGGGCSRCGSGGKRSRERAQPRIEIGPEGDEFEIEAERMAERVVAAAAGSPPPPPVAPSDASGSSGSTGGTGGSSGSPPPSAGDAPEHQSVRRRTDRARAFRRCACGGSCGSCKADADQLRARRAPASSGRHMQGETGALAPRALGPGRALPANTRSFMESQFGVLFENVRIHDGAQAAEAALSIGAQAYTVGADIVFGAGQFQPSTPRGIHLLAHELTHVVQQGAAGQTTVSDTPAIAARSPLAAQRQAVTPNEPGDCPPVPTGLGHSPPSPVTPRASHAGTTLVGSWHFCLDSNTLVGGESLDNIPGLIAKHHSGTRYLVHGHASTDGDAGYNERLAGHRANVVGDALTSALRAKLGATPIGGSESVIRDRIDVGTRGETEEFGSDAAANRVVTLHAEIPGSTIPEEPDCENAPRRVGDVPFEVPCDRATVDLEGRDGATNLTHFGFCLDSDTLTQPVRQIGEFAGRQASTAVYTIHGFASAEGSADYNQRLSCHRAMRVARELMNAGVRSENIREVAGIGETNAFSFGVQDFEEANRVAVVLAENAHIESFADGPRPATNAAEKRAIVDDARSRLVRGQYRSEADFYINKWTCGHTPTVAAAVDRLTIELRDDNKIEKLRDPANGEEEDSSRGFAHVVISNAALGADNPIECVMGRLVDMSFHHSVLGEALLNPSLTAPRPERKSFEPPVPPSLRHRAGLHLITLAGLDACEGETTRPQTSRTEEPTGIDRPRARDPLRDTPLPVCASAPQPTRSLGPMPGDADRDTMNFAVLEQSRPLLDGTLENADGGGTNFSANAATTPSSFRSASDVMNASATVALIGQREHFDDYEIGFMQTVIDDLFLAEYVDGSQVLQKLPLPIRAAHLRGGEAAPAPWMAVGRASARPNSDGIANVSASWRLDTDFAFRLNQFRPPFVPSVLLDTWQRHTRVALWLAARRRGMPLDRFSVFPINGSVYEVDQNFDRSVHRIQGDMMAHEVQLVDPVISGTNAERETFRNTSQFRAREISSDAVDMRQAKFDRPVSSEIDMHRQFQRIIEPPAAADVAGMGIEEYKATAKRILDNMRDEGVRPDGSVGEVDDPRLGFGTATLKVTIRVDPETGRLPPYSNAETKDNPITISSAGLGSRARYHLARALALRMQKRDFLGTGRAVILKEPNTSVVEFEMPPLAQEVNLLTIPGVISDMRAMWACSSFTKQEPGFLCPLEFAMTYTRDRNRAVNRRAFQSRPDPGCDEKIQTDINCDNPDKMAIGMFHTHPQDSGDALGPSPGDLETERRNPGACGAQLFIVSEDFVTRHDAKGNLVFKRDRRSLLGDQGTSCPIDVTPDFKEEVIK